MRLRDHIQPRIFLAAALTAAFTGVACSGLLDVSDPSRYLDDALNDPRAFGSVANGVEGTLHAAIDDIVINTALLSDEFMHTGTWTGYEDADQGRYRQNDTADPAQTTTLTTLRREAQEAEDRFVSVLGNDAYNEDYTVRARTVKGLATLMLAQGACEGVLTPAGAAVADTMVYQEAIQILTAAMEIAQSSGNTQYLNTARAARARANLMVGNYDAALADASAVPDGFVYLAKFPEQGANNSLVTLNHYPENKAAGLDSRRWAQVDTIAGFMVDKWSGELDTRVKILFRVGNRLGVDGRTPFYSHDKYTERTSPIRLLHWREMRLIEAEVYWRKGQFQQAIDKMNVVRADPSDEAYAVPLPPLTNPGTSEGVRDRLLEERFMTLFLEGQRANDLYRFQLFPTVIGTDFNTKFQLDDSEVRNNPNTPLPRPCPRVS